MRRRGFLAGALLLVPMATIAGQLAGKSALRIELVVRTIDNFKNEDDVAAFFEKAHSANVAIVHINAKQDEDDERPSGEVYYASAIAPVAAGYEKFDALAASIAEGRRRGIKVYAWLPQFHDQAALRAHPQWQMIASEHGKNHAYAGKNTVAFFVNPIDPEVQAYELSLVAEVARNYQVDGISLDWLRFDDMNMDTGPVTRRLAQQEIGLDPATLNFSASSIATQRWQLWRTQKLRLYVRQLRQTVNAIRPDLRLALFLLPPQFTEVGQDLSLLSDALDAVYPMAYFKDWSFPPSWVAGKLMADVERKKTHHTNVKPTLDGSGTVAQNIDILSAVRKKFPQIDSIAWFTAGYWQQAEIDRIVMIHLAAARRAVGGASNRDK